MMNLKTATIVLGVLGWLLSYAFFWRYLVAHDWDVLGGWVASFTANDWATGLLMDLVLVTGMVIVLVLKDRRQLGLSVSMALTLYLVALWRTAPADQD